MPSVGTHGWPGVSTPDPIQLPNPQPQRPDAPTTAAPSGENAQMQKGDDTVNLAKLGVAWKYLVKKSSGLVFDQREAAVGR